MNSQYPTQKSISIIQHNETDGRDSAYFPQTFSQALTSTPLIKPILEQTATCNQNQRLLTKNSDQIPIENKTRLKDCHRNITPSNSLGKLHLLGASLKRNFETLYILLNIYLPVGNCVLSCIMQLFSFPSRSCILCRKLAK